MQNEPPATAPEGTARPGDAAPPPEPVALPLTRPAGCPFDPPAELARLRAQRPLSRLQHADGHVGWLATSHSAVRAIAADTRFSSRYELIRHPLLTGGPGDTLPPATLGDLTGIDPPEHTRYRRLLAGKFTVRRMRALTARVEQITAEHLDAMARRGPTADLVAAYAHPVPALMICELLGVAEADRETFQRHAAAMSEAGATVADQLAAGLDTTANMLGLGTFALLRHPAQAAALRADPGLADRAVEELLRYLSIAHTGARAALEDVEVDGQLIEAGETVTLAVGAANRDPARFPDPDTLDLHRKATGHLAFGHGIHQCLGQQLARVEMRIAFPALFRRFPTLRLAVPPEEVPLRPHMGIHGVQRLPVTWDET